MDLSVIIINHNTRELSQNAVASLYEHTKGLNWEIILVDNSTEERERFCPLIENPVKLIQVENRGFSHGCNMGFNMSSGRHLLFLNSDTLISNNLLPDCVKYLDEHQAIGVLGVKTFLANGLLDHSCKRGFPTLRNAFYYFAGFDRRHPENPKYCGYHLLHLDPEVIHSVDAISGAFMMTPRKVFEELGGFDQDFFMYGEDLDYCFRTKETGRQVIYYPRFSILHLKGRSGFALKKGETARQFYRSMKLFYRKHYRQKYGMATNLLAYAAITALYIWKRI